MDSSDACGVSDLSEQVLSSDDNLKNVDLGESLKNDTTDSEINCDLVKKFVCSYDKCIKSFARLDRLVQHERVHTGERPFKCHHDNCSRSYTRANHLKRHIEQSHVKVRTPNDVVICEEDGCYKTFVSKDSLKKHLKMVHNINNDQLIYHCPLDNCKAAFSKRFQLRHHEYQHRGVNPFQCQVDVCGKKFPSYSKLQRHLKVHEGYKCTNCPEIFSKWSLLRKHKSIVHKDIIACQTCGQKFKSQSKLKVHSLTCMNVKSLTDESETEIEDSSMQCFETSGNPVESPTLGIEIPKDPDFKKDYENHMKISNDDNNNINYNNNNSSSNNDDINDADVSCTDSKNETTKRPPGAEIPVKLGLKHYKCEANGCTRSYTTLYNLKTHIRICHNNEHDNNDDDNSVCNNGSLFICGFEDCMLQLSTKQKLQLHSQLHTDEYLSTKYFKKSQAKKKQQVDNMQSELSIISKLDERMKLIEKPAKIYDEDDILNNKLKRIRRKMNKQHKNSIMKNKEIE